MTTAIPIWYYRFARKFKAEVGKKDINQMIAEFAAEEKMKVIAVRKGFQQSVFFEKARRYLANRAVWQQDDPNPPAKWTPIAYARFLIDMESSHNQEEVVKSYCAEMDSHPDSCWRAWEYANRNTNHTPEVVQYIKRNKSHQQIVENVCHMFRMKPSVVDGLVQRILAQ